MTYRASLDTLNKILTIIVIAGFLFVGGLTIHILMNEAAFFDKRGIFIPATMLVIVALVIAYGFSPKSYSITNDSLLINRPFKPAVYSLADIAEISQLENGVAWWGFRLFGVGGFFGFYGRYWNRKLGHTTLYATRFDNKILITFKDNRKIIITPDSIQMMDELKKRV